MRAHLEDLVQSGAGDAAVTARAGGELADFQYTAFQQAWTRSRERYATRAGKFSQNRLCGSYA